MMKHGKPQILSQIDIKNSIPKKNRATSVFNAGESTI